MSGDSYSVIVIDPPWPVRKGGTAHEPGAAGASLDYQTMALSEIGELRLPMATDCHVWLWTTHAYLPAASTILQQWGIRYLATFVWCKPGGPQPIGMPAFDSEFALYGRHGSPRFTTTKGLSTYFTAPRGRHSEKPEAFYELVRRCTAGSRLDMFSRRQILGFDVWGDQVERFHYMSQTGLLVRAVLSARDGRSHRRARRIGCAA